MSYFERGVSCNRQSDETLQNFITSAACEILLLLVAHTHAVQHAIYQANAQHLRAMHVVEVIMDLRAAMITRPKTCQDNMPY